MLFQEYSLPFIVQVHSSLFPEWVLLFSQNSEKYCGVYQLQKNNPKLLEYFEFAASSKMLHFIKWYMLFQEYSLPFIVQVHSSLFPEWVLLFSQNSEKYCGVYQLQKNNPKLLEYFEFAASSDELLVQQEKFWFSRGVQNSVSTLNL